MPQKSTGHNSFQAPWERRRTGSYRSRSFALRRARLVCENAPATPAADTRIELNQSPAIDCKNRQMR